MIQGIENLLGNDERIKMIMGLGYTKYRKAGLTREEAGEVLGYGYIEKLLQMPEWRKMFFFQYYYFCWYKKEGTILYCIGVDPDLNEHFIQDEE
ncbi:MAG: hypothetical protein M0D57_04540 [Sphingobacteriales bacterium JAD_PAG50586_3]|nr:MAG: hypothetical protein M0D57_04540 [Sphingobacteriales bacterium JAD_PAG50586_3]